jgi:hypothetical protein
VDLRRPRAGEWALGLAGAVLFGSLFLSWYGIRGCDDCDVSGWSALAVNDAIVAAAGLLAIAALITTLVYRTTAVPIAVTAVAVLLVSVAMVLAIVRLAFPPEVGSYDDLTRELGLFVALATAAGAFVAGIVSMRDERPRRAPGDPAPPEARVLPRPEAGGEQGAGDAAPAAS